TVAALGGGILLMAGFVAWERRAPEPMLPLRLFGSLESIAANTTGSLMTASRIAAAFFVPLYFQDVLGLSPLDASPRLLPWSTVAPQDMGKASGANSTLQRFGAALGIAVTTAVFAANGHLGTPASFDAGLRPALAVAAGLSLLGAVTALAVTGRRRRAAQPVK